MTDLEYTLFGRPKSWQRDNWVRGRMIQDKRTREGKAAHAEAARLAAPGAPPDASGTFSVHVSAYYDNAVHGDADRVLTLVLDALQGIAYVSDRQVKRASVAVSIDRLDPRTEVTVHRIVEGV